MSNKDIQVLLVYIKSEAEDRSKPPRISEKEVGKGPKNRGKNTVCKLFQIILIVKIRIGRGRKRKSFGWLNSNGRESATCQSGQNPIGVQCSVKRGETRFLSIWSKR